MSRQAAARGVDVGAYAATLLEEAAHVHRRTEEPQPQASLTTRLRELAQFSHKIPLLPDEAFSRESLYRDHD